jgi:hypothetical protein
MYLKTYSKILHKGTQTAMLHLKRYAETLGLHTNAMTVKIMLKHSLCLKLLGFDTLTGCVLIILLNRDRTFQDTSFSLLLMVELT